MLQSTILLAVLAGTPVSLQFEGPLKEGLKQLAEKSQINLVVIGDLSEPVQLNLPAVDSEEALETIAAAYGLEVTRKGPGSKLWVVKKATGTPPAAQDQGVHFNVTIPALPPIPPLPAVTADGADGEISLLQRELEEARARAEKLKLEAEKVRGQLEGMKSGSDEVREKVREALETAREQANDAAEEARDKAEALRDAVRQRAEEAREQAREQAESARENAREQAQLAREQARLAREQMELQRQQVSTGGPLTVEKGTRVESAVAYGGPVIVEEDAVVEGDAVAFGGDVIVKKGAVIEGDAVSFGGSVTRHDDAVVRGESVSLGGANFGAKVARNVVANTRPEKPEPAKDDDESPSVGKSVALFLVQFSVFFGLGFLLMLFAPHRMKALEATIRTEPVKNGLAGMLGAVASIPLTAAMVFTVVGIPVAVVMWIIIALCLPAGVAIVANALGSALPMGNVRKTQAMVLAVGLLVLLAVAQVPVLGVMALVAAMVIAFGAMIRTRFGQPGRSLPMVDSADTVPTI